MYFRSLTTSLLAFSFMGSAQASATYDIQVKVADKNVTIQFSTKQEFTSMCTLEISKLTLQKPVSTTLSTESGLISFDAARDPMAFCATAFGPHSGDINFNLGMNLPMLTSGTYDLVINGAIQGELKIVGDKVTFSELLDPVEIPFSGAINSAEVETKLLPDGSKEAYVVLSLSYSGGCMAHEFALTYGKCYQTYPAQCEATLLHTKGAEDPCEAMITDIVRIKLPAFYDRYYLTIAGETEAQAKEVFVDLFNP